MMLILLQQETVQCGPDLNRDSTIWDRQRPNSFSTRRSAMMGVMDSISAISAWDIRQLQTSMTTDGVMMDPGNLRTWHRPGLVLDFTGELEELKPGLEGTHSSVSCPFFSSLGSSCDMLQFWQSTHLQLDEQLMLACRDTSLLVYLTWSRFTDPSPGFSLLVLFRWPCFSLKVCFFVRLVLINLCWSSRVPVPTFGIWIFLPDDLL